MESLDQCIFFAAKNVPVVTGIKLHAHYPQWQILAEIGTGYRARLNRYFLAALLPDRWLGRLGKQTLCSQLATTLLSGEVLNKGSYAEC